MNAIWWKQVEQVVDAALAEDLGSGDITTEILIPRHCEGKASIVVKGEGVLAGIDVAAEVFHRVDASLEFQRLIPDGSMVHPGDVVATVAGSAASIIMNRSLRWQNWPISKRLPPNSPMIARSVLARSCLAPL